MRWGIIGLGNIAKRFARSLAITEDAQLYAVCTGHPEHAAMYVSEYGAKPYTDRKAFLADPDLDIVYIALPHAMHKEAVLQCLNAHKAVLCEKPAGLNAAEWQKMTACASENNTFLQEGMKSRFTPCRRVLKEMLATGIIGEVKSVRASFCSNADANPALRNKYLYDPKQGGCLLDTGSYPIAFVFDLLGDQYDFMTANMMVDDQGIDHETKATFYYPNTVTGGIFVALDQDVDRYGIIGGTNGRIEVPYYYRATSFSILTGEGEYKEYSVPLIGDDFSGEITACQNAIQNNKLMCEEYSWKDSESVLMAMDEVKSKGKIKKRT